MLAANRDNVLTLATRLKLLDGLTAQVGFGRVLRDLFILAGNRVEFCSHDKQARSDWLDVSEHLVEAESIANELER